MKRLVAGLAVVMMLAGACQGSKARSQGSEESIRLGIFPNLTHAPGLVALASGILEETLAPTKVDLKIFNSGSEAQTAILAGSLDATYIGPSPTAALYLKSKKIAVISGATANGASLVVRKGAGITKPSDLKGKKVAIPGLGNTQDIALRTWLADNGLKPKEEGGDVSILAVDNPQLPQVFRAGQVDAAWEPEPWPSVLVDAGTAEPFLDEADLWPDGRFLTTDLIASTAYLGAHASVVRKLVEANVKAIQLIQDDPERAKELANQQLEEVGAAALSDSVLDSAWDALEFTYDPLPASLQETADHAHALGILEEDTAGLDGVFRLDDLTAVLAELDLPEVDLP